MARVDYVDGLVHEPTQVHEDGIDLTVAEIYDVSGPGRIDFGGGELEPADLIPHEQVWRNPDDDYQWWDLDAGTYVIEHNERIDAPQPVVVQPRVALLDRGAFHPTVHVTSLDKFPLTISGEGLRIKENARVSTVVEP